MAKIIVQDTQITVIKQNEDDYISLTDMLKAKDGEFFFSNWLRNRNTIEFLGIWERLMNPNFNCAEFDIIKSQAGLNRFRLSAKEWTEKTNAIGIISKAGRYGGTYAHKDIAFEFAMWISPEFKVYLIREFQRLKDAEQKQLGWTAKRELSKINYRIHTDAIKQNLIPEKVTALQASIIYAEEADVLNVRHVSRSTPSGNGSIIQVNNYYPFGGLLKDGEHHWDIQNRFYNGKEYDRMQGLNLYDYSARQYDPAVCQFTSIDPLCEKSYNVSPYVYCHSNPVKRIDPDGKDDFELQKNGQLILRNVGGKIDNIYYGKKSFSIAHGAFGKTTKNMIGKDFSGRNANFSNVKDGLKFMRTVSNFTGKETQAIGVGNAGRRELIVGAWKNNTIGENAYGTLSNKSNATFKYDASKSVAYFIHTHPKVSGYPDSGRPFASEEDLKKRTSPTAAYYIMTSENGKIHNYSLTKNRDEELKELRQESVLY